MMCRAAPAHTVSSVLLGSFSHSDAGAAPPAVVAAARRPGTDGPGGGRRSILLTDKTHPLQAGPPAAVYRKQNLGSVSSLNCDHNQISFDGNSGSMRILRRSVAWAHIAITTNHPPQPHPLPRGRVSLKGNVSLSSRLRPLGVPRCLELDERPSDPRAPAAAVGGAEHDNRGRPVHALSNGEPEPTSPWRSRGWAGTVVLPGALV